MSTMDDTTEKKPEPKKPAPIENPSRPLWCASLDDPALILTKGTPGLDAGVRYMRSRALADLADIPQVQGATPVLVELAPLSAEARASALSETSEPRQRVAAFRYAARRIITTPWTLDAGAVRGDAEELELLPDTRWPSLAQKSLERAQEILGGMAMEELGSIALQRASVSPRALAPFRVPSLSAGG